MGIGSGISFTVTGVLQALSNLQTTVLGSVENTLASLVGPYRPAQWSGPAQTTITVPGNSSQATSTASLGVQNGGGGTPATDANAALGGIPTFSVNTAVTSTPDTMYVFDAVFLVEHTQEMVTTEHPVQNGANMVDHAYQKPFRMTMEIGMSDAMDSYILGQWSGPASSKSVSAYQTLLLLERSRTLVTVTARLNSYSNMLIESIHTRDDHKTKHALRATIVFKEIFMATVNLQTGESARPYDTEVTGAGMVPTLPVPTIVGSKYFVTPPPISTPTVTGAGDFSSNPIGS